MYQTDHFIRFVNKPEHAEADMERGHSFAAYQFFDTPEQAGDFADDYGYDREDVAPIERDGATQYGVALPGLAGFGPYETREEAEHAAREKRGYNGVEWPFAAIFTGSHVGETDGGDGDLFRPKALLGTVDLRRGPRFRRGRR